MTVIEVKQDSHRPTTTDRGVGGPRAAGRLDGAAEVAGGGALRQREVMVGGEIGLGRRAKEAYGGGIVGSGRGLGGVEGSEPDFGLLPRVTDLGDESAPRPLPDAAETRWIAGSVPGGLRSCSRLGHHYREREEVVEILEGKRIFFALLLSFPTFSLFQ